MFQTNHTGPCSVPEHSKSLAYYSQSNQTDTLVVFVHGFGGESIKTWGEFKNIMIFNNDFKDADIIFFGYDSLKIQVNNSALRFKCFLTTVIKPKHKKIILVGHSLGAVVIRLGLINAKMKEEGWVDKCRMILFAPAHSGAIPQQLILECLTGPAKIFAAVARYLYPVIDELGEKSKILPDLLERTKNFISTGSGEFTRARFIIWAENEKVVINKIFCGDPPANEPIPRNTSHVSVCKPRHGKYTEPVEILVKCINL